MDPNACVERINLAISIGDWDEVEAASRDLVEWLGRGGFPPTVSVNSEEARALGKGRKEASGALFLLGRLAGMLTEAS